MEDDIYETTRQDSVRDTSIVGTSGAKNDVVPNTDALTN